MSLIIHYHNVRLYRCYERLNVALNALDECSSQLQRAISRQHVETVRRMLIRQQDNMFLVKQEATIWRQVVAESGHNHPQIQKLDQEVERRMQIFNLCHQAVGNRIMTFATDCKCCLVEKLAAVFNCRKKIESPG